MNTTTRRIASGMRNLLFGTACAVATIAAANPAPGNNSRAIDPNEPINEPGYHTHHNQARQVCGGPVIPSGDGVIAGHVIVVRLNGTVERMDTTDAWNRSKSKTTADDIWVVGVCKKDVQ